MRAELRANAEAAIAAGVFGVPAFEVAGKVFWGLEALPILRQYLVSNPWFQDPQWDAVQQVPLGVPKR